MWNRTYSEARGSTEKGTVEAWSKPQTLVGSGAHQEKVASDAQTRKESLTNSQQASMMPTHTDA
jgi:hypothetical protein